MAIVMNIPVLNLTPDSLPLIVTYTNQQSKLSEAIGKLKISHLIVMIWSVVILGLLITNTRY